jgi:[ribosomal protein S5]-alanine N-acetyltransferase
MTDVLIRDVPDDVNAAVDARAYRLGLSRSEYVRHRLAQDAAASGSPVSALDLAGSVAAVDHVLATDRLVLPPVTPADHAALLAHWTTPQVRQFLFDGAVLSAAEITETIEDSARDFATSGYGLWLIRQADGTDLVGTAGLRPLEDLGLEVYYSLVPGAQGRGLATEAARAVVEHALGPLGLPEVLAEVDEDNTASAAVLERLGMTPFEVVPGVLGPMIRYRKTR